MKGKYSFAQRLLNHNTLLAQYSVSLQKSAASLAVRKLTAECILEPARGGS